MDEFVKALEIPIPSAGMRYGNNGSKDIISLLRVFRAADGGALLMWNGTDRRHYERAQRVIVHPDRTVEAVLAEDSMATFRRASTEMATDLGMPGEPTLEQVEAEILRNILAY